MQQVNLLETAIKNLRKRVQRKGSLLQVLMLCKR